MAKNLKINIKNTQLAAALNLNKPAKPAAKKTKAKEVEAEEAVAAPAIPPVEEKEQPAPKAVEKAEELPPPPPEKVEETPPPPPKVVPPVQKLGPILGAPPPRPRPPLQLTPRLPQGQYSQGSGGYRTPPAHQARPPFQRRESGPPTEPRRPLQLRPAIGSAPAARPPGREPSAAPPDENKAPRKTTSFKEFKDLKPQRKTEDRSFDSRDRQGLRENDDDKWKKRRPSFKSRVAMAEEEPTRPKQIKVRIPITLKDLAVEMKLKASQLVSKLFMHGVVLTLNDYLDDETTIQLLGHELDCQIEIDKNEEKRLQITDKTIQQEIQESDPAALITRPPIVTFMGHVDHGKTSLIDSIRKSKLAAGEAGAITQHIGAFRCHTQVGDITILDTPGHEAFSEMRARGALVTDIVVLVIAGDEGMRTQTLEALQQAKEAKVTIVVAINKCDKPNFNAETVYRQLADNELLPEVWGGTTLTINCSAVTGVGVKELLEMLALQSEILELKANPLARARGTVIESEMHKGLGPVCTLLIQNGTLRKGDSLVFGQHWAKVKTMHDEKSKDLLEAGPSTPAKITGLSALPEAGSEFIVVKDEREARDLAQKRSEGQKRTLFQQSKRAPLENLLQKQATSAAKKTLALILRADVQGSVEALKTSIMKITSTKVDVNIISAAVGEVSESDIQLAAASKATIIGFHTKVESHAEDLIKQAKVAVKLHDIIYHAVDDVRKMMKDLLDKIPQEVEMGEALVKAVFKSSQFGSIAGCQVTEGLIKRNHFARLLRAGEVVWKGSIASLKRVKEDVREVSKGYECGILLQNFNDVKEGDILQAYEITYLEQEL